MDDSFSKLQDAGVEISRKTRILIRERNSRETLSIVTMLFRNARHGGLDVDSESFHIETTDEFDPETLLEFSGALLHDMSEIDLIKLVSFLANNPRCISGLVLEGTVNSTIGQRQQYVILQTIGVLVRIKPIINLEEFSNRILRLGM